MLLSSVGIFDPCQKLGLFRKWDKEMDINRADEISYTTQFQEAFLKYVENEYCAKRGHLLVIEPESVLRKHFFPSSMAQGSSQSFVDPYDLSSVEEDYLILEDVGETTPGQSNRAAHLLTAAKLYLNSLPESPTLWGQVNLNLDDYHSDPVEICRTYWIPDIIDWWRQYDETHPKYTDFSNVAREIISISPHGVRVEAGSSSGRDVMSWRQSNITGETIHKNVMVGSLLEPITRFWLVMIQYWIH